MLNDISSEGGVVGEDSKRNVRDSINTFNKGIGSLAAEGKNIAGTIGERAKVSAADVKARVEEKATQAIAATRGQVRRTPGVALGVAAGLGALFALLATSRR